MDGNRSWQLEINWPKNSNWFLMKAFFSYSSRLLTKARIFRCPWTPHSSDQTQVTPLPRPQQFYGSDFFNVRFTSQNQVRQFWLRPHLREAQDFCAHPTSTTATATAAPSSSVLQGSADKSERWPQHSDDTRINNNNNTNINKTLQIKRSNPKILSEFILHLSDNFGFSKNRIFPAWAHSDRQITRAASTRSSITIRRQRDLESADPWRCRLHLVDRRHSWVVGRVSPRWTGAASQRTAPAAPEAAEKEPIWPTQRATTESWSWVHPDRAKRRSFDSFCTTSFRPSTLKRWTTCTGGSSKFRVDPSGSTFRTSRARTSTSSPPWGRSRWPRPTLSSSSSLSTRRSLGRRYRGCVTWSTRPKIRKFRSSSSETSPTFLTTTPFLTRASKRPWSSTGKTATSSVRPKIDSTSTRSSKSCFNKRNPDTILRLTTPTVPDQARSPLSDHSAGTDLRRHPWSRTLRSTWGGGSRYRPLLQIFRSRFWPPPFRRESAASRPWRAGELPWQLSGATRAKCRNSKRTVIIIIQ